MKFSLFALPARLLATLSIFAVLDLASLPAASAPPDARMFGPWVVVQQAGAQDAIGLRLYFSPDGNFFLIDPKTQLGMAGSWVVGRAGLLVSVIGNGRWAKLWDADVAFPNPDFMMVDVVESQLSGRQRFVLQRVK